MKKFVVFCLILSFFALSACESVPDYSDYSAPESLYVSEASPSSPVSSEDNSIDEPSSSVVSEESSAEESSASVTSDKSSEEEPSASDSSEESSIDAPSSVPDASETSSADESSAEESSAPPEIASTEWPKEETAAITAEIAGKHGAGFETNIEDCEELRALSARLEGTGYGFFYCDLEYKGYAAYGCDTVFKTASTAKLPYIKYLCTLADSGELDVNEMLTYEERHKDPGSGILKNLAAGAKYSVGTLMDYALRYSDNIAYKMLIERFGLDGYFGSVADLGVSYTTAASGYANCSASTMAALLFDVARYTGAHRSVLTEAGCNASYNRQIGAELAEYKVLQKYGAMKPGNIAYHDMAVVYAPHPYILLIYTTIDYESAGKDAPFREIARLTDNLNKSL